MLLTRNQVVTQSMPNLYDLGGDNWVMPGHSSHVVAGLTITANELYYCPIFLERQTTFVRIGISVGAIAAGAVARLGIYAAIFDANGQLRPNALRLDAGTRSVATVGEKEIPIAETLAPGFHFLAYSSDGAPQLRGKAPAFCGSMPVTTFSPIINAVAFPMFSVTVVDGAAAFPSPATTPDLGQSSGFRCVHLRT